MSACSGSRSLPKFPPKKLKKLKEQVVDERKESLARYMNDLLLYINIFADPDICAFIAMRDKEIMRAYFKSLYEYQENIMKMSCNKISDVSDKSGNSEDAVSALSGNRSPIKLPQQ